MSQTDPLEPTAEPPQRDWAIVLHGGAGSLPGDTPEDMLQAYRAGLQEALDVGIRDLERGAAAVDVVEQVVTVLEDRAIFNAGKGSVFTAEGTHELDASIMEGHTLRAGAVGAVERVKNPVRAARLVMDQTPHILLVGDGADRFAAQAGCEIVEPGYFFTARRFAGLRQHQQKNGLPVSERPAYALPQDVEVGPVDADRPGNTVGCVALDRHGHLAAATSTGGLNGKLAGRVGDTPLIGAGTYATDTCAASGTGWGEKFIRHLVAARVVWLVEGGQTPQTAADHCLQQVLQPGDGGLIALDAHGRAVAATNTGSMPHAIADSAGRREIGIWMGRGEP